MFVFLSSGGDKFIPNLRSSETRLSFLLLLLRCSLSVFSADQSGCLLNVTI